MTKEIPMKCEVVSVDEDRSGLKIKMLGPNNDSLTIVSPKKSPLKRLHLQIREPIWITPLPDQVVIEREDDLPHIAAANLIQE